MQTANARATIVDTIRQNRLEVTRNLDQFFIQQSNELLAGGVPRERLAEAMFTVALVHKIKSGVRPMLHDLAAILAAALGTQAAREMILEMEAGIEAASTEKNGGAANCH